MDSRRYGSVPMISVPTVCFRLRQLTARVVSLEFVIGHPRSWEVNFDSGRRRRRAVVNENENAKIYRGKKKNQTITLNAIWGDPFTNFRLSLFFCTFFSFVVCWHVTCDLWCMVCLVFIFRWRKIRWLVKLRDLNDISIPSDLRRRQSYFPRWEISHRDWSLRKHTISYFSLKLSYTTQLLM